MIRFLISRPVAVIMTFLALLLLGIVASNRLPVSLMPDIDIPEITVAISRSDVSARELENTVVSVLRRNLMQVPGIDKIESESRNGSAIIRLSFKFGNDINLAFMEVNEKVDGTMNYLPRDLERPRIIKASATDIPVFMLNITMADEEAGDEKFMELSKFAETVIKKRIEQLPEVGMADITGQVKREIYITPDEKKIQALGITENFFFRYRRVAMSSFGLIIIVMFWFFFTMKKEKFPAVRQDELVVTVDWNENIDLSENLKRVGEMVASNGDLALQTNSFVGEQQFLFNRDYDQSYTQARVYIKGSNYREREAIEKNSYDFLRKNYPDASVSIEAQKNIFEKIFSASETPLIVEVSLMKEKESPPPDMIAGIVSALDEKYPGAGITGPQLEDKILMRIDPDRLLLYDVDQGDLYNTLKTSLNKNSIGDLRASYEMLPIVLSDREKQVGEILSQEMVLNKTGQLIPVKEIVGVQRIHDYKTIKGGMNGEYVPLFMNVSTNQPSEITADIRNQITKDPDLSVEFSGALITGQKLFRELAVILVVALLLLYFILAAQFESLTQPFIVLLEIPIDIAGALFLVKLWGGTINIMTMIGLIVMSGVIINDSILKVDTINNLRAEGMELKKAIYTAGSRRLKPILMVAMASLISTAPILLSSGIGSELQRPMALALIGGMSLGTVVSLFFIPLAYWYIYKAKG